MKLQFSITQKFKQDLLKKIKIPAISMLASMILGFIALVDMQTRFYFGIIVDFFIPCDRSISYADCRMFYNGYLLFALLGIFIISMVVILFLSIRYLIIGTTEEVKKL